MVGAPWACRPESTPFEPELGHTSVGKRRRQASSPVAFMPSLCGRRFRFSPPARDPDQCSVTSPLDWALIVALLRASSPRCGCDCSARGSSAVDYLVAGRRVTLPAFVATLVATWYGGILGVGEYSYRYGVVELARVRRAVLRRRAAVRDCCSRGARAPAALYTLPDLLDRSYGRGPALAGAVARVRDVGAGGVRADARHAVRRDVRPAAGPVRDRAPRCSRCSTSTTAGCAPSCSRIRCSSCSCTSASS